MTHLGASSTSSNKMLSSKGYSIGILKKKLVERLTGTENLSNGLQQCVNCPSLQWFCERKPVENKGNDAWKIVQIAPCCRQQGIYCKTSCLRLIKKVLSC